MTTSAYVDNTAAYGDLFKRVFANNSDFTTWIYNSSTWQVYKLEYWATPTIGNCPFAQFLNLANQTDVRRPGLWAKNGTLIPPA